MRTNAAELDRTGVSTLLRGEAQPILQWTRRWDARRLAVHVGVIVIGAGLYGAAMGWWRAPQQALFTGIKFPLIILLTTMGTTLLNAMLAPLLGLDISFRQSFLAIVMSHAITAAIMGSFSPLTAFVVWNSPELTTAASSPAYDLIKLMHVAIIAFAGIAGNVRLYQLLVTMGGSRRIAWRVLLAWLAGNFFFGSQLSWVLRPFIGTPHLAVEFIRSGAWKGGFCENVFNTIVQLLKILQIL